MTIQQREMTSRRAILGGGLAAVGALVAGALGRPAPARAANGDPVLAGQTTTGTSATTVQNTTAGGVSLQGYSTSANGVGVFGYNFGGGGQAWGVWGSATGPTGAGLVGTAPNNGSALIAFSGGGPIPAAEPKTAVFGVANQDSLAKAVYGVSGPGTGVYGESTSASGRYGVRGRNASTSYPAVLGHSSGNATGVLGYSGSIPPPAVPNTGVYGLASQGSDASGVYGETGPGAGVRGIAHGVTGFGVIGLADSTGAGQSYGVFARSSSAGGVGLGARGAADSTGVLAMSGLGTFPAAKAKTGVYGQANQDANAKGVWGHSATGRGVQGSTTSGYAGYFSGKVFTTKFYELAETATPAAAGTNRARLFVRDNGAGKTQLCVRFSSGAVRVLATQA
jgi:hypothetical protein